MSRSEFHDLLHRYLKGECDQQEKTWIDRWYQSVAKSNEEGVESIDSIEDRLWQEIKEKTKKKSSNKLPKLIWLFIPSAAILLLVLKMNTMFFKSSSGSEPHFLEDQHGQEMITCLNESDTIRILDLPDESQVHLHPNSSIQYASGFLENRELLLSGDARFKVSANPANPFLVFNESTVTKVLGTEFFIRSSPEDGSDEVIVYSGRVAVSPRKKSANILRRFLNESKPVQINANHRVAYNRQESVLETSLIECPVPVNIVRPDLRFEAVSLPDLAATLATAYQIHIVTEDSDEIKGITFSGDLNDLTLYDQLDLVARVTETNYQVEGAKIYLFK